MSKGSQPRDQTVTQTNIPKYARPYVTDVLNRASSESQRDYEPYGGDRLAEFSDPTQQSWDTIYGLGSGIPGMAGAQAATGAAMQGSQGIAGLGPSNFSQYGFNDVDRFTGQNVGQYMSPYIQHVLDNRKSQAMLDFNRMQSGRDASAVQAGAFGGSRHGVVDALAQEDLMREMDMIQSEGMENAYNNASGMFQADRSAIMGREAEQAGELGRVQAGIDQSRQQFGRLGLDAYGMTGSLAGQMADLGGRERAAGVEQSQLLQGVGQQQEQRTQAGMDLNYEDFLRQQYYPREQLMFYNDLIRGNVRQQDTTTMQLANSNPYSQLLGGGITALSLRNAGIF